MFLLSSYCHQSIALYRRCYQKIALASCFADIAHKEPLHGQHSTLLDGIRGIAALLVLADHCGLIWVGAGANGVWLFFVLSGYLLAQPFINRKTPYTALEVLRYLRRRLLRIMPMYFLFVCLYAAYFHYSPEWLIGHLTLHFTDNHLWTIKEELAFYIILPFVMTALCLIKLHPLFKAIALIALGITVENYLMEKGYFLILTSHGAQCFFYLTPFLAGIAAAYVNSSIAKGKINALWYSIGGLIVFAVPLLAFNWYAGVMLIQNPSLNLLHQYHTALSIAYAAFIIWILHMPEKMIYGFFNAILFRAIGVVGYSFYLLQALALAMLTHPSIYGHSDRLFLCATVLNYFLSCITYSLVEKPCMGLFQTGKKLELA